MNTAEGKRSIGENIILNQVLANFLPIVTTVIGSGK